MELFAPWGGGMGSKGADDSCPKCDTKPAQAEVNDGSVKGGGTSNWWEGEKSFRNTS